MDGKDLECLVHASGLTTESMPQDCAKEESAVQGI